jgi:ubiquinone/menaquinone biosynthesis C-methylase UbiE
MKLGDFSENAAVYEDARPGYPGELVDQLIADAQVTPTSSIAEIGAGTGKFTRLLVDRGFQVTALEPGEAMRNAAPSVSGVTWTDGTFSETGLETSSQDWVVAAQSFHWAKPETDLPELHRVLKPDRRLTVFWNDRRNAEHPVLKHTVEIIAGIVPEYDEAYRQLNWAEILTSTGHFTDVIYRQQEYTFAMSASRFLNYWRSHNRFGVTAGPQRREQFLSVLKTYLDPLEDQTLQIPLVCQAWSARRS